MMTRFSALGDVAMTLPPLYDACRANPGVRFVFVTRPRFTSLFVNPPANLTVVGIDPKQWPGPKGMWSLTHRLASRYGADTYVDLHDVLRTRLMRIAARLLRLRVAKLDKQRGRRRALLSHRNAQPLPTPTVQRYAEALQRAGLKRPANDRFTSIYGNTPGPAEAFGAVATPKQPGETWIAIAPFAAHQGKRLPMTLVADTVRQLTRRPATKVFAMGFGPDEAALLDTLPGTQEGLTLNMARADIGMEAELSLLSWCDAMVSADSANMHLASLTATPVVSVWGATHPDAGFLGYGQSAANCVQLDLDCRPCSIYGNRPCHRPDDSGKLFQCLNHLTSNMILKKLDKIINKDINFFTS